MIPYGRQFIDADDIAAVVEYPITDECKLILDETIKT